MPLVGAPSPDVLCAAVVLPSGGRLVVLAYPGRPDVNVWLPISCPQRATNGWVRALGVPL